MFLWWRLFRQLFKPRAGANSGRIRAEGLTHTPRINSEILNSKLFARMSIVFRHGSFVPCSNP
jgi:hypothetical protein